MADQAIAQAEEGGVFVGRPCGLEAPSLLALPGERAEVKRCKKRCEANLTLIAGLRHQTPLPPPIVILAFFNAIMLVAKRAAAYVIVDPLRIIQHSRLDLDTPFLRLVGRVV